MEGMGGWEWRGWMGGRAAGPPGWVVVVGVGVGVGSMSWVRENRS